MKVAIWSWWIPWPVVNLLDVTTRWNNHSLQVSRYDVILCSGNNAAHHETFSRVFCNNLKFGCDTTTYLPSYLFNWLPTRIPIYPRIGSNWNFANTTSTLYVVGCLLAAATDRSSHLCYMPACLSTNHRIRRRQIRHQPRRHF